METSPPHPLSPLHARRGHSGQAGHLGAPEVPLHEERPEGGSKLLRHQSVKYEAHGGIDQRQEVHQLAEGRIAVGEEALLHHTGQQAKQSLRKLRDQEQHQHRHQEQGGAIITAIASRWSVKKCNLIV